MDLVSEGTRLLQRDADWATVASEGSDLEGILSYWTDDAVVLAPGLPVVAGKDALRLYVQGSMQIPGFKITWTSTDVTFSPDGKLIVSSGVEPRLRWWNITDGSTLRYSDGCGPRAVPSRSGAENPMASGVVPWIYGMRSRDDKIATLQPLKFLHNRSEFLWSLVHQLTGATQRDA